MSQLSLLFAFACVLFALASSAAIKCYTCRGINCLRTTRQNVTETCLYEIDDCVTIFNKFSVVAKGCLTTMSSELRQKCSDRTSPECQICNGDACNDLGRADFKCYECSSKSDTNCARNPSALPLVQCKTPTSLNSYCFTSVTSDGIVERGCSLHVKEQTDCLARDNCNLCSVEEEEGCNNRPKDGSAVSGGVTLRGLLGLIAVCLVVQLRL